MFLIFIYCTSLNFKSILTQSRLNFSSVPYTCYYVLQHTFLNLIFNLIYIVQFQHHLCATMSDTCLCLLATKTPLLPIGVYRSLQFTLSIVIIRLVKAERAMREARRYIERSSIYAKLIHIGGHFSRPWVSMFIYIYIYLFVCNLVF